MIYQLRTTKKNIMKSLNEKIEGLKNGESIVLTSINGITCSVEKSGDGKKVRFVRTFANGSFECKNI